MKKRTSKKSMVLRTLLLVPITALLVYGFSEKKVAVIESSVQTELNSLELIVNLEIDKNDEIWYDNKKIPLGNLSIELLKIIPQQTLPESIRLDVTHINELAPSFIGEFMPQVTALGIENLKFCHNAQDESEQQGASREQMKLYNSLAKKYNEMSTDHMRIEMKDVEQLKYIYGLMSEKQRADAEPFPDFPDPPPAPEAPEFPEAPGTSSKNSDFPNPPTPPAPKPPLDHVIEMAKKGADFYYEGEKISSDRAIELLKKNKDLNIDSRSNGLAKPTVKISKSPITIKR